MLSALTRFRKIKQQCVRLCSNISLNNFDIDYICNSSYLNEIMHNIGIRKGVGNINRVLELYDKFKVTSVDDNAYNVIQDELLKEITSLPNKTHPAVITNRDPAVKHKINDKRDYGSHNPLEFSEIVQRLNLLRTEKLGTTCGHKSYYFLGELAELEEALIKYTVSMLLGKGFQLTSVPDILPRKVLESCGMAVNSDRTQVSIVADFGLSITGIFPSITEYNNLVKTAASTKKKNNICKYSCLLLKMACCFYNINVDLQSLM